MQRVDARSTGAEGPRMRNSIVLAVDPSRLASLPAPVLGSHPSRMLPSGPRRRLATRAPRPRSSTDLSIDGPLRLGDVLDVDLHGDLTDQHLEAAFGVDLLHDAG